MLTDFVSISRGLVDVLYMDPSYSVKLDQQCILLNAQWYFHFGKVKKYTD